MSSNKTKCSVVHKWSAVGAPHHNQTQESEEKEN